MQCTGITKKMKEMEVIEYTVGTFCIEANMFEGTK